MGSDDHLIGRRVFNFECMVPRIDGIRREFSGLDLLSQVEGILVAKFQAALLDIGHPQQEYQQGESSQKNELDDSHHDTAGTVGMLLYLTRDRQTYDSF